MPAYTLACTRCRHQYITHMSVPVWKARLSQRDEKTRCFPMETCPRCRIRGRVVHDFVGDAKTQASHDIGYTFYENAPDEILRGEKERHCTKAEAARLMKEHGLAESGAEAPLASEGEQKQRIAARFKRDARDREQAHKRIAAIAERIDKVSQPTVPSDKVSKAVDRLSGDGATLATTWIGLKKQAKALHIKSSPKWKRPDYERHIREVLNRT